MSKLNEQSNFNPEQLCWENAGAAAAQAVYQMRRVDDAGEMLECATLDALMETLIDDGATFDGATFDALVVTNAKIEAKAKQLGAAFNRAGAAITVAENGVTVTKPFKKNGSTQICMMFEMTDGQTITVFLHNPDAKPNTLQASDVLISWKWLLNRKDITIVVAKEHGKDLAVAQVAARVMALVDKNAGRFAKANAGRAARMGAIAALEGEVAAHEATLKGLIEQIEAKKNASNAKEQPETAQTSGNNLAELYEKAKDWTMEKPAFGGKNFGEWLASAPADAFIWIGNHGITVATNVDGEQKGVLVTAVDNPPAYNLLGDAAAAGIKTVGQLRDELKVTAIEAQVQSAPIVLTGKELGDFDTSTPEGKKALRAALKDYLMAMQGDSVDCPILGDKVMIEKRGIKETLAFTGNPIKMKALYAIKDLIKTARSKDKQANFKADKKGNTQAYFHLKNSVSIDGVDVSVDLIVEQTADGHYHYDMLVEKTKATLDSVAPVLSPPTPDNYSGSNEIAPIKPQTADDVNATFDAATGKMVLNLFLQIKDPVTGEWVDLPDEDVEERPEPALSFSLGDMVASKGEGDNYIIFAKRTSVGTPLEADYFGMSENIYATVPKALAGRAISSTTEYQPIEVRSQVDAEKAYGEYVNTIDKHIAKRKSESRNFDLTFDLMDKNTFLKALSVSSVADEEIEPEVTTTLPKNKIAVPSITLEWSEASDGENVTFNTLDELQEYIANEYDMDAGKLKGRGYDKHKIAIKVNGEEEYQRIDVSASDGNFNPFTMSLDSFIGSWLHKLGLVVEQQNLDGEADENTHVQAMIAKANSNGFTDLAAFFEQDAAHCLYPFDTLAQIAVDPNKSKEDYLAEAAKVANVMRQTSENADIINDMMVARFGKGNAASEATQTAPQNEDVAFPASQVFERLKEKGIPQNSSDWEYNDVAKYLRGFSNYASILDSEKYEFEMQVPKDGVFITVYGKRPKGVSLLNFRNQSESFIQAVLAAIAARNTAPETSPAKTLKDLTDNETYQKILKDSMGGIMFNVADKGKYDVSELLAIWNAIPLREQEAAGGTVNGVMEFVLDGYVHVPQGDEANPVPDADVVKIRDAVDYLRKNYFGGKSDGVVIASEDGTYFKTVNNNKQSITRAVSELGRSHGGSRSFYADTSLSSNYAAGQTLEELGVRVDRSDPKDFVPSWLKVGDVYNMRANGNRVVPAEIQSFGGLLMGKDEPIVNLSSGHTGYNYPLSDFKKRLEGGEFKELEGSLSDFETKKELFSLYVNSKGNEVLSVTKYTTYEGEVSYSIKSSSGSGGTYTYETAKAAVVREKEYVSSMKLKSGHDFLSPNSVDPDVEVQKATDTPVEQAGSNNDQAFLQSIIDGKQSEAMASPDFADKLTDMYARVQGVEADLALFNSALQVYTDFVLEDTK